MNKIVLIFMYCFMAILLSGCWDNIDVEDRGFVIGTAIDLADEQGNSGYHLNVMNQIVVPSGYGTPGGQGGGGQKAYKNLEASGVSILEITREMSKLTGRAPYYEHLKILAVSEEVAQEPELFASFMDLFIRDQEMRREIRVIITEDEARNILTVEPEGEKLPIMYIHALMDNYNKSLDLIEPVRMGDIHEFLLEQHSYVIPKFTADDNLVQSRGVAVFSHNNTMVGTLTGEETKGLNLIKGNIGGGGVIEFEIDNQLMMYEIGNAKSNIKIDIKGQDNIDINITIDTEGRIAEMFGSRSLLESKYLSEIEKNIGKKIEKIANGALEKAQKELQTDVFDFGRNLKQRHYDEWEKIKDDWDSGDNIFAKSTINVSANAIVRTTGATDQAKEEGNE